jgi:hypothetical protein
LRGTAPYTMKRLQKNIDLPGNGFTWPAVETWELPITLKFGTNRFSIVGYDFRNQPAATLNVTIISNAGLPDSDDDGMPDEWEVQYNLDPQVANGAEDPDHDGFSNLSEYLAGTSPTDGTSRLGLTVERMQTQQLQLTFTAQAGHAYRLQYQLALGSGWKDLLIIPATATSRIITQPQTISSVASSLFYRVILDPSAR